MIEMEAVNFLLFLSFSIILITSNTTRLTAPLTIQLVRPVAY